ncbi:MAG: CDP-glucose 4,6-dehydratase, partial [Acidimicrobiales bacterium]|nr:CDP-glucose 4,6-dehydratase [Acidimicrobiales bacterium]
MTSTGTSAAFGAFYRDKRVLVTGHTGFKGSWLSEWLLALGADVVGYALDPLTDADMYVHLDLANRIARDERGDLADLDRLAQLVEETKPEVVFHLAAQPLVRLSYEMPVETFATNVMGTINVMEAVRRSGHSCSMVMVTTDKCYANREWLSSYREQDAMGGHDPYSASKGAAELVIASYRSSFWSSDDSAVAVASGRAGNVIGGGDWALDRIIPDCIRAVAA